ncbi:MAG: hypothetical protein ACOVLH_00540 [Roseateles sp.]
MTLKQASQVRRWMQLHGGRHPVELQVWDLVLILWVLGWAGVPGLLLSDLWVALPLCLLGYLLPTAYTQMRLRLHRCGKLRCDWLTAL